MTQPHTDPDGLVEPAHAQPDESPMVRVTLAFTVFVFLSGIIGTATVDYFAPLPEPDLVGAERAKFHQQDADARWLDGSKARRIEVHKRLTSRVRAALGPVHTALLLRYFGETGSDEVLVGEDGWLFLDRQVGLAPRGQRGPSIDRSAALLAAAERRITAIGTRFVAVPIPRKSTVLADFAPRGVDLFPGMESELFERLDEHGVESIDLRPMFDGLEPEDRYLKYDSHWAQKARVRAAELMAQGAGVGSPEPTTHLTEVPWTNSPSDLLRFAGVPKGSWVRSWVLNRSEVTFETHVNTPKKGAPPMAIQAVKDSMTPLALFGTSFSRRLGDYLAHFADTPVFDGTQPGGFFLDSLANLRQCYNFGAWPEVLWYEFPVFKAFRLRDNEDWVLSTSQGFSLSVLPIVPTSPLLADLAPTSGMQRLAIERGHLITSGNGIAMVRVLRQSGSLGGGLWRLRTANFTADVPWHAARQELLIPIVATHDLGGEVELLAKSNGAPGMKVTATLVTDLDLGSKVVGSIETGPTHPDAAHATQRVTFNDVTIERHSAIVAQLDLGSWQGPLELRSRTTKDSTASWQAVGAGKVTIVLDLSRHAGEPLASFEVTLPEAVAGWRIESAHWAHRPR